MNVCDGTCVTINNVQYVIIEKYIDFLPFEGMVAGRKRKGKALGITLKSNDFRLFIETVYDREWIKELKINDKKDISKFIVGLEYKNEKEWMYLSGDCNCILIELVIMLMNFILMGILKNLMKNLKLNMMIF